MSFSSKEKWEFERKAWARGFNYVAGVDEAGRGPIAGPIVAAAVVLREDIKGLDDSKRLSVRKREELFDILINGENDIGVSVVPPSIIDSIGIQMANYMAMTEAVFNLKKKPDLVLVDGYKLEGLPCEVWRIIKGDRISASIGAASIVAKVTRDRIMNQMDAIYPGYGFAKHKGYATKEHLVALEKLGPSPIHRFSFAPLSESFCGELFYQSKFRRDLSDV
ncbi:MAG: ribonuclease HII [Candidatus Hydrogenedentes bacterium]|nr:ribonuclease HII [Candidatus Hydrogenedentota bacterium]